jgi:hypothetical protein
MIHYLASNALDQFLQLLANGIPYTHGPRFLNLIHTPVFKWLQPEFVQKTGKFVALLYQIRQTNPDLHMFGAFAGGFVCTHNKPV